MTTKDQVYTDLAFINFRSYCREHNWIFPIIEWEKYKNINQIIDHILKQQVDVLCISTYLWNANLCYEVCKKIKKINPKIIIIQGGPLQKYDDEFFEKNYFIDYMCHATSHGELFLKEILNQINHYGKVVNPKEIPFMICREHQYIPQKTKFEYPEDSSFEYNIDYISEVVGYVKKRKGVHLRVLYETTRGCPYSCTYCEWGGGTNNKVSMKSMDVIKREIDLFSLLKIERIDIADANLGMLNRDVEILEHIGQNKIKYGYPRIIHIHGIAKVKLDKKEKILDIVEKYNLCDSITLSIQTLDPIILKNIKRTDIKPEENFYLAEKYKKSNIGVDFEFIMGMPGYTLDHFYEEFDFIYKYSDLKQERYVLNILPETELYSDFQRKMWKIKTINVGSDLKYDLDGHSFYDKENTHSLVDSNQYFSPYEVVVSTYSYSTKDWKEMYIMNRFGRFLKEHMEKSQKKPSVFMRESFQKIKNTKSFSKIDDFLNDVLEKKIVINELSSIFFEENNIEKILNEIVWN